MMMLEAYSPVLAIDQRLQKINLVLSENTKEIRGLDAYTKSVKSTLDEIVMKWFQANELIWILFAM